MPVTPMVPETVRQECGIDPLRYGMPGVAFVLLPSEGTSLLKLSAQLGFPTLTVPQLSMLWSEIGVNTAGAKPTTLAPLLHALMQWALDRPVADQELERVLRERGSHSASAPAWSSAVDENPELLEIAVAEEDHEEVKRAARKAKAAAQASEGQQRKRPAEAAPADVPEQRAHPRIAAPANLRHYSQSQASLLCPRIKGCTISPVGNRQWQIKYLGRRIAPRSHSCTYVEDAGSVVEHCRALYVALQWAWRVHHEEEGHEECPHNLESLLLEPQ